MYPANCGIGDTRSAGLAPRVPTGRSGFQAVSLPVERGVLPRLLLLGVDGGCDFDRLSAVDAGWFPEQSHSSAETP